MLGCAVQVGGAAQLPAPDSWASVSYTLRFRVGTEEMDGFATAGEPAHP